ncbi:MAG TPA: hypothetical protein PK402_03100 [Tepidisphaeraceae bacterium]|nr:hypothetical protein [Tepidisphaeraceae bacterium]
MGFKEIEKQTQSSKEFFDGKHQFEHWYVANQVYFITAHTRDHFRAFASEEAKTIFWNKLDEYTKVNEFFPWVVSLLDNHYHMLGYNRHRENLPALMQRLHGSTAKLVNDLLVERRSKFWRDQEGRECFDGCIRDPLQARRAYRYTLNQAVRARVVKDWRNYPHTRVFIDCEVGIRRATELGAFLKDILYHRYDGKPYGKNGP